MLAQGATLASVGAIRGRNDNSALHGGALALALTGEQRQAERALAGIAQRNTGHLAMNVIGLPTARAAIALHEHDPARAVALLEPTRNYESAAHFWPTYLRGQAYLKLKRGAEAAAEFQTIIDHRGWDPLSPLWPLAHLGLAQAAALTGETQKSQTAYRAFLALWSEADADLPALRAARQAVAP
jgi:predicted Zn-dependent protease